LIAKPSIGITAREMAHDASIPGVSSNQSESTQTRPANVFLVGPMGAGKSSIGRPLARELGFGFVDLDELIATRTGAAINLIFELEGEAGFRTRESAMLAEIARSEGQVVATGGGAVLADGNRRLMRERGVVVHLAISVEDQMSRLARDTTRPLLATPDREARLRTLAVERAPLYAEVADLTFATRGSTPRAGARRLAALLRHQVPATIPANGGPVTA
jgi:shikimate kinase